MDRVIKKLVGLVKLPSIVPVLVVITLSAQNLANPPRSLHETYIFTLKGPYEGNDEPTVTPLH